MKYRRLGKSGVKLSEIGLGGWLTFGHVANATTGRELIGTAFDSGINFFDTANAYAAGACESMWGELLGAYTRSSFVLATKVFNPMGDGPNQRGLSRKHMMASVDASLKRLGTDYIDLYQMHHIDRSVPVDEIWLAMDRLIAQGKITYVGSSNFAGWTIAQANEAARSRHFLGLVSEHA